MKKNLLKLSSAVFLSFIYPVISYAQAGGACGTGIGGAICKISGLLSQILPVLISLGVIYFIWGVVWYFIADSEEAKKKGKDRIIYGVIGLAVIVSVWGLVNIVTSTFFAADTNFGAPNVQLINTNTAAANSCIFPPTGATFQSVLGYFTCLIQNSVIPFIFALAVVMFIWGAVKFFIINADEEAKRAQGKQFMIWGIIALAVMISVWGLVGILRGTFGFTSTVLPGVKPTTP